MTKKRRGDAPIHPGEILLEEFLKSYDPPVSQVEAAHRMHIPKVRLNQLIRGNRGVRPDTALRRARRNPGSSRSPTPVLAEDLSRSADHSLCNGV